MCVSVWLLDVSKLMLTGLCEFLSGCRRVFGRGFINHSCGCSRGHRRYVGYIYMGSSTDQGFVLGVGSKGATDHVLQLNKVAVKSASCSNE